MSLKTGDNFDSFYTFVDILATDVLYFTPTLPLIGSEWSVH